MAAGSSVDGAKLRKLNFAAAALHWAQGVACVILLLTVNEGEGYWFLSYRVYDEQLWRVSYRLAWLIPSFLFISAVAHTVQLLRGNSYVQDICETHHNPLRWIEYMPSAGVMIWVIANLSGIEDPLTLGLLVLVNVALQYSGYLVEEELCAKHAESAQRANVLGWFMHAGTWIAIFVAFFATLNNDPDGDGVPTLVYVIPPVLFALFTVFGIPLERWRQGKARDYAAEVEVPYIVLSLAAKTTLAWFVFGGVMRPRCERDADVSC